MIALVSLRLGLELGGSLLLIVVILAAIVWIETHRPLTSQELRHELEEYEDVWSGFDEARHNHPLHEESR